MSTKSWDDTVYTLNKEDLFFYFSYKARKTGDEWDVLKEETLIYPARLYLFPRSWIATRFQSIIPPDYIISHLDILFCSLPNSIPKPSPESTLNLPEEALEQQVLNEENKQYTTMHKGANLPDEYRNLRMDDISYRVPFDLFSNGILLNPTWNVGELADVFEELKNTIDNTHAYSSDWNEFSAPNFSRGWCLDMWIPIPVSLLTENKSKIFKLLAHIRLRTGGLMTIPSVEQSKDMMFDVMIYPDDLNDLHEEIEMDDSRMYTIETLTVSHLKRKNEMDKDLPLDRLSFKERNAEYYESREKIKENLRRLNY